MKKLLSLSVFIVCVSALYCCKKADIGSNSGLTQLGARDQKEFPEISTYEKSHLVFESEDQLIEFEESLENATYNEALEFLESLEFEPLAASFGPELVDFDDLIDPDHYWDFVFGESGVVQIGEILFKPVEDYDYILILKDENFTQTNYENLLDNHFDIEVMSKIATFDSTISNLFIFIEENPSGYESANPTMHPTNKRKFFGWVTYFEGNYYDNCCAWREECGRHYIFGIGSRIKCKEVDRVCLPICED